MDFPSPLMYNFKKTPKRPETSKPKTHNNVLKKVSFIDQCEELFFPFI